jgi:hypothetical protein
MRTKSLGRSADCSWHSHVVKPLLWPNSISVQLTLEKKAFTEVPHHYMPSTVPQSIVPTTSETEVMAPVMLIMLELLDLCGDSAPSLLMVQLDVDSLGTSAVASISPSLEQMLVSVESHASLQELCDC